MPYGAAIPALTYTVNGFVNSDMASVLTGGPTPATTATSSSAPGRYPITISQGTLSAANYTFTFVPGTLTITQAQTTTTLTSSANPSVYGQAVTFTATVCTPTGNTATPTGTVQFSVDQQPFGTAVTLGPGQQAGCALASSQSTSSLAVGNHSVTATYTDGSDGNFLGGSDTLSGGQQVNQAQTATTLMVSPNPATFGQPLTLTATVAAVAPAVGTPTGTVTFADGTATLGSATLAVIKG